MIASHQYGSQVRPTGIRELGQSSKAEAFVEALPGGEALENNSLRSGGRESSKLTVNDKPTDSRPTKEMVGCDRGDMSMWRQLLAEVGVSAGGLELDLNRVSWVTRFVGLVEWVTQTAVTRQSCISDTDNNTGEYRGDHNWIDCIRPRGVLAHHALEPVNWRFGEHGVRKWFVRKCGCDHSARGRVLVESKFSYYAVHLVHRARWECRWQAPIGI